LCTEEQKDLNKSGTAKPIAAATVLPENLYYFVIETLINVKI